MTARLFWNLSCDTSGFILEKSFILKAVYGIAAVIFTLILVAVGFSGTCNLIPDAETSATTWNYSDGDLIFITDGKTPIETPDAGAYSWPEKGMLLFEFDEAVTVAQVRVFTGTNEGPLYLDAYLGGRRHDEGGYRAPNGTLKASLKDSSRTENGWIDFSTLIQQNSM